MPSFNAPELLTWLHVVAMATFGGSAITALVLSGLEDAQPEFRGLSAAVWSRVAIWGARLALVLGIALLVVKLQAGEDIFRAKAFHFKLVVALAMMGVAESAPKGLAQGRRGAALLAVVLFLLTTFLALNKRTFGYAEPKVQVNVQTQTQAPATVHPAP